MFADVTSAAFADATFHLVLDSGIDLFVLKTEVFECFYDKFNHYWGAAGYGYGVFW